MIEVDVAIVGVGIAGAFALRSLRRDLKVLGIDKREKLGYPVECGEIIPTKREMKVLLPDLDDYSLFDVPKRFESNRTKEIHFVLPNGRTFEVDFEFHVVRRDEMIRRIVEESGHDLLLKRRVNDVSSNGEGVTLNIGGEKVKADVVVASDGANSRIAKCLGVWNYELSPAKQYVMSGVECDEDVVYMFIGRRISPGAYGWIIPKGNGVANVGVGFRRDFAERGLNIHRALDFFVREYEFSSIYTRKAEIVSKVGAVVPIDLPLERAVYGRVLFAGDAASMIISHVGGGIPTSMVAGDVAGRVISDFFEGGSLENYDPLWKKYLYRPLKNAYFYRKMWDSFSDDDRKVVRLMRLLSDSDMGDVLRCRVPVKARFGSILLPILARLL